jgi:hypothetical protein
MKIQVSLSKGKKQKSPRQEFLSALMKEISAGGDGLTTAYSTKKKADFSKYFDELKARMSNHLEGS